MLAASSYDGTIKILDSNNDFNEIFSLAGHRYFVLSICFSPDGNILASSSGDGKIKIWDCNNEFKEIKTFIGHNDKINTICFSINGGNLISGYNDEKIKIWDCNNDFKNIITLNTHSSISIICVSQYSPQYEANIFASGCFNGNIRLWNSDTFNKITTLVSTYKAYNSVMCICFSPDGNLLAGGYCDKTIKIWDMNTFQKRYTLSGHTHFVFGLSFLSTKLNEKYSNILISGCSDITKMWDCNNEFKNINTLNIGISALCFSNNGSILVLACNNKILNFYNMDENTFNININIIPISPD